MKSKLLTTILIAVSITAMAQNKPVEQPKDQDDTYYVQAKDQVSTRIETLIKLIFEIRQPGILPEIKKNKALRTADSLLKADIDWYNGVKGVKK